MATLAVAAAGAYLGSAALGTATVLGLSGAAWGWAIGSVVGNMLFNEGPEDQSSEGSRLSDLNVTSSAYNSPIPRIYGNARVAGNVIWALDHLEVASSQSQSVGGKGGGSSTTNTTYNYFGRFAVAVAEGEIGCIKRIWADGKVIYDSTLTGQNSLYTNYVWDDTLQAWVPQVSSYPISGNFSQYITVYTGTSTQNPDPLIEANEGIGTTPAYRNLAYVVFDHIPLEEFGNRIPNLEFEVISNVEAPYSRTVSFLTDSPDDTPNAYDNQQMDGTYAQNCSAGGLEAYVAARKYSWDFNTSIWEYPDGSDIGLYLAFDPTPYWDYVYWHNDGAGNINIDLNCLTLYLSGGGTQGGGWIELSYQGFNVEFETYTQKNCGQFGLHSRISYGNDPTPNLPNCDIEDPSIPPPHLILPPTHIVHRPTGDDYAIDANQWFTPVLKYNKVTCSPTPVDLREICESICSRAGLLDTEVDFSRLDNEVYGYVISNTMTARAAIQPLQKAYFFDLFEADGKIIAMPRTHPDRHTGLDLDDDSLGAVVSGESFQANVAVKRAEQSDIPRVVRVGYMDQDSDYMTGEQIYSDPTNVPGDTSDIDLAIVMSGAQAKAIAILHQQLAGWDRVRVSSKARHALVSLTPTDIVTLQERGNAFVSRLESVSYDGRTVQLEGVVDYQDAYTLPATIPVNPAPAPPPAPAAITPTIAVLLDIPLIDDADDNAGWYVGVRGVNSAQGGWRGAQLMRYISAWTGLAYWGSTANETAFGLTSAVLPDVARPWVWDRSTVLEITLDDENQTLESIAEAEALQGGNLCAIGGPGRWELLHYANAVQTGADTWEISTLLRGVRGTEHLTGTHQAVDRFVPLNDVATRRVDRPASEIGTSYEYSAVTTGQQVASANTYDFTNEGVGLLPYAPVMIRAERDPDMSITWARRSRIDAEWDATGTPARGEDTEEYDVELREGATLLRTARVITNTAAYTLSEYQIDSGNGSATEIPTLEVTIYQISATVQRGTPGVNNV